MTSASRYEFGNFRLDAGRRRLETMAGEPLTITAKAFDTLVYLVRHPGELVLRQTLLDAVWPDTIVHDNNLNQAIALLRKVLGPESIVTVPGRGYQFAEPVRVVRTPETGIVRPARARRAAFPLERSRLVASAAIAVLIALAAGIGGWLYLGEQEARVSLAVLPVDDPEAEAADAHFADAFAADIMTLLTETPGLRVPFRESSFALRGSDRSLEEIAVVLDVEYLFETVVSRDQDALTVQVVLSEAEGGWRMEASFEENRSDATGLQRHIVRWVIEELRERADEDSSLPAQGQSLVLRSAGGTDNPEAQDRYDIAENARWNANDAEDYLFAVENYRQAIALDWNFGRAHVGLAKALDELRIRLEADFFPAIEEQRKEAVSAAIEFARQVPAALGILAQEHVRKLEWSEAERAFRDRIERTSRSDYESYLEYGMFLSLVGRSRESITELSEARDLNPLSAKPLTHLAIAYDALGETEKAFELDREMQRCCSDTYDVLSRSSQIWRVLAAGDTRRAREMFAEGQGVSVDEVRNATVPEIFAPPQLEFLRMVTRSFQLLDDPELALEALRESAENREMANPVGRGNLALFAAFFGDDQLAVDTLRRP